MDRPGDFHTERKRPQHSAIIYYRNTHLSNRSSPQGELPACFRPSCDKVSKRQAPTSSGYVHLWFPPFLQIESLKSRRGILPFSDSYSISSNSSEFNCFFEFRQFFTDYIWSIFCFLLISREIIVFPIPIQPNLWQTSKSVAKFTVVGGEETRPSSSPER